MGQNAGQLPAQKCMYGLCTGFSARFFKGGEAMRLWELFLIGVGLSMDAFAVAVCRGLTMKKINWRHALVIGLMFGGFQALMPFLGYLLGRQFEAYIVNFDHWIAFGLLAAIGAKMIHDSLRPDGEEEAACEGLRLKQLLVMAVATSIDALAVGVTFAFLNVNILTASGLIGVTTFFISVGGVAVGNYFGAKYKNKAEFAGGAILILIGLKILLEHLGVLAF